MSDRLDRRGRGAAANACRFASAPRRDLRASPGGLARRATRDDRGSPAGGECPTAGCGLTWQPSSAPIGGGVASSRVGERGSFGRKRLPIICTGDTSRTDRLGSLQPLGEAVERGVWHPEFAEVGGGVDDIIAIDAGLPRRIRHNAELRLLVELPGILRMLPVDEIGDCRRSAAIVREGQGEPALCRPPSPARGHEGRRYLLSLLPRRRGRRGPGTSHPGRDRAPGRASRASPDAPRNRRKARDGRRSGAQPASQHRENPASRSAIRSRKPIIRSWISSLGWVRR